LSGYLIAEELEGICLTPERRRQSGDPGDVDSE